MHVLQGGAGAWSGAGRLAQRSSCLTSSWIYGRVLGWRGRQSPLARWALGQASSSCRTQNQAQPHPPATCLLRGRRPEPACLLGVGRHEGAASGRSDDNDVLCCRHLLLNVGSHGCGAGVQAWTTGAGSGRVLVRCNRVQEQELGSFTQLSLQPNQARPRDTQSRGCRPTLRARHSLPPTEANSWQPGRPP